MKGIKCKGKLLNGGEWINGYYVYAHKYYGTGKAAHFITNIYGEKQGRMVDPNTVSPYIGKKDKKGNEICKGDIVMAYDVYDIAYGELYEVKYNEQNCQYRLIGITYSGLDIALDSPPAIEIVGNIYDNPELLKDRIK